MKEGSGQFAIELAVRDYECDAQGIVNNAVYLNYLEHARHEFLKKLGLDFVSLHQAGRDAVLARAEVDFLHPLRSGDRFRVEVEPEARGRLRLVFHQTIFRVPDGHAIVRAQMTAVLLEKGKPVVPDEIFCAMREKGFAVGLKAQPGCSSRRIMRRKNR